jgi:hypothetical protein
VRHALVEGRITLMTGCCSVRVGEEDGGEDDDDDDDDDDAWMGRRRSAACLRIHHVGGPENRPSDSRVSVSDGISWRNLQPCWVKAHFPSWIHLSHQTFLGFAGAKTTEVEMAAALDRDSAEVAMMWSICDWMVAEC